MSRIVSRFSCGAASAVATKLAIESSGTVFVINAFLADEHPDNRRFLADCEKWFGVAITVLRDEKYGASTLEVFKKNRFMVSRQGAPCTKFLKRTVLDAWGGPDDVWVLGYTLGEEQRLQQFVEANPSRKVVAPLIEGGISKADCFALLGRAGIELPAMYRLGYNNANCVGCVKGGMGYWNKIRVDFPQRFEEMAALQEELGAGANFFHNKASGARMSLRDLPVGAGRHKDEGDFECGTVCEQVAEEFNL